MINNTTSMPTNNLAYIIENDLITATIAEAVLRRNLRHYQVQHWANGQVAFDQLVTAAEKNAGIPGLILLDLDMPVMDGWEFLDSLVLLPVAEQTCVFILTSSIHPDDRKKANRYSVVKGFLSKPLDDSSVAWMQQVSQLVGQAPEPRSATDPTAISQLNHPLGIGPIPSIAFNESA